MTLVLKQSIGILFGVQKNPFKELITIISVISSIRQFRPSIIHSIASLFTG